MRYAQVKEWTEETELRVRIPEADTGKNTFEMELNDGTRLRGPLSDLYQDAILEAFENYNAGHDEYVLIQGIVRKDRNDHLKSFESIEHATPLDPLDISLRLEELSKLEDGWLDGKGQAPAKNQLVWLQKAFNSSFDNDLPLPYIYPTAEGGVQAEWTLNGWEVSFEINLETLQGEYQALNLQDRTCDEETISLADKDGWSKLNDALKQLETRRVEEQASGL
jgi:hypothetical protein